MRLFPSASLFAVTLMLASGTAAAAPGGATAKRVARRPATSASTAGRPLPAPLPKAEVLPPLPPVARDVTAITTLTSAPLPDWTSGGSAAVAAPAAQGTTESLPPLPPVDAPAAAGTSRDLATAPVAPGHAAREVKPAGWVLDLGAGVLAPTSSFVPGVRTLGPGASFELALGYYATPHFGILAGIRGSYGHTLRGCSGSCGEGYSYQVPVMFQLAAQDRTRGVYAGAGIGLATTYGGKAGSSASYTMTSPVEAKLALGYRFAGAGGVRPTTTVDLNFGMDIGSIDKVEVQAADGTTASASGDTPTHVVVALSLLLHSSL